MKLGELVNPDVIALRDYRKTFVRCSVKHHPLPYPDISFLLPMHKADRLFLAGSIIILEQRRGDLDPLKNFFSYLTCRDHAFPHLPELRLHSSRIVRTRY